MAALASSLDETIALACRIDYLQGTISFTTLESLHDFLDSAVSFPDSLWGFSSDLFFKSLFSGMYGRIVYESDSIFAHVFFPGRFCSQLSDQLSFVRFLVNSGFKITRLDIALDDFCRRVSFDEVRYCGENSLYSLVETYKCIESGFKGFKGTVPTCYFGSGDKILRFYNAEVVHGILADRWELQLRDDWARMAVLAYLENSSVLPSIVVSAVDFVQSNNRRDRSTRLGWWQSLTDTLGEVRLHLPTYQPSLARTTSWLDRQVAVFLAVLRQGLGRKAYFRYLDLLADRGQSRFKPYHKAWVLDLQSHRNEENKYVC